MPEGAAPRWKHYRAEKDVMPLGGYAVLVGIFNVGLAALIGWAAARRRLPPSIGAGDIALLGAATHKLTRLVGKDFVTSPLRAPFVEFAGSSIAGEVKEKSRGHGLQRAVGDLVTCEYCLAPWVAAGLFATYLANPRAARFASALFGAVAVSDFLNRAYVAAAKKSEAVGAKAKEQRTELGI